MNISTLFLSGYDMKDVITLPGFDKEFAANFKFRQEHAKAADKTMRKLISKLKQPNPLWTGIHVRRRDYQTYEKTLGLNVLKPSYYLHAMDMVREFYPTKDVIFVVVTDDVTWCKHQVKKRAKDVFIVSKEDSEQYAGIGHDLAIMSKCNQTIISRGSFSYLSSILTKGRPIILPCQFSQYRTQQNDRDICVRHPLKNPLKNIYTIQY